MNVDAVEAGLCRAAGGLPKGSDNSLNIGRGHFPRLTLEYRILDDRRCDWIDIRHDRLAAGMRKLAKNPTAVLMHCRGQPRKTRDQRVGVNADLPRGALTDLFDVSVSRDQEPGAAAGQRAVEVDQFISDFATFSGHRLRRRRANETIGESERADFPGP